MAYYYVLSLFLSFFCEKGNCCDVYRFGGYIVMRLTLSCFFHLWTLDRKDDFDIEKVYIFQKKVVSVLLFPNGIRRVKEIAMMGMGLGLHTYQALSFTFLILFFNRNIFSTWHILNVEINWNCFDRCGFGGPMLIRLTSLNFHISAFGKEMITLIWSKLSMGGGGSETS